MHLSPFSLFIMIDYWEDIITFSCQALKERRSELEQQLERMKGELRTKTHDMEKAKLEVEVWINLDFCHIYSIYYILLNISSNKVTCP